MNSYSPSCVFLNAQSEIGSIHSNTQPASISGAFTIEMMFNVSVIKGSYVDLISTRVGSSPNTFSFEWDNGNMTLNMGNGSSWLVNASWSYPLVPGSWYHLAIVVNGTSYTVYLNGVQAKAGSFSGSVVFLNSTNSIYIGQNGAGAQFFYGRVAEFRVWNTALALATIQAWMYKEADNTHPNWVNLQLCWHGDEGTGTTLSDASGHGYTGALQNGAFWGNPGFPYQAIATPSFNVMQPPTWTPVDEALVVAVNGKIYVIGGRTTEGTLSPTNINQMYDPVTNTWTAKAAMHQSRYKLFGANNGNLVYAIGGYNGSLYGYNEVYDTSSNAWTSLAVQPTPTEASTANFVIGSIYCAGGFNGPSVPSPGQWAVDLNQAYDTLTNTWSQKSVTGFTPVSYAAEGTIDGILYVYGGWDENGTPLILNQAYDPASDTWTRKNSDGLTAAILSASAIVNGQLYAFGGSTVAQQKNNYTPNTLVMVYSPSADAWQSVDASGFLPVAAAGAAVVSGIVYILGGASTPSVLTNMVQIFTPPDPLPAIPALSSPANGATPPSGDVTFSWSAAANATSYEIQVATDSGFTSIEADVLTAATSQMIPGLSIGTAYYWRVKSINAVGSSNWSEVWSIWTGGFAARPQDVYLRNATVMVDLGTGSGLQDIGLVADVKAEFEPVTYVSPIGDVTVGYTLKLTVKMRQTAISDAESAVLNLAQRQLAEIQFLGEQDKIDVKNFFFNPDPVYDFAGGESAFALTGSKKIAVAEAIAALASN